MKSHYSRVKKWFETKDEDKLRGLNSDYGLLSYALYITEKLNFSKNSKVLEIGCGDAKILQKIKEIRKDLNFWGIDISETLVQEAKKNNPRSEFHVGNAIDGIPFDVKFDYIFSFSTAQYFFHDDFINLNHILKEHLRSFGKIAHFSIPDISKRTILTLNSKLETKKPNLSIFKIFNYIRKIKSEPKMKDIVYSTDGSYWHNAELICEELRDFVDCRIYRPSDSWYRFDLHLSNYEGIK